MELDIDLKSGKKVENKGPYNIFRALYKGNIELCVYKLNAFYHICIEKDDTTFARFHEKKIDCLQKRMNKCIIDIENRVYNKKKTTKQKIMEIIEQRSLTSFMNNTKWREFREAMINEMPFQPPYINKTLFEEETGEYYSHFNKDVSYLGNYDIESFVFLNYKIIEWVKVRPRYIEVVGGMLANKKVMHDAEDEFISILNKYNIPYEENEGVYIIYGYK